jgi:membrane protein
MEFVRGLLPDVLEQLAARLVVSVWENSSGGLVGISAVAALWSAGRGIYGLMEGLNAVWDVRETRSWLVTRLICMGYTLAFFLVLFFVLAVHLFGSRVLGLGAGGRFLLLTALQTLVFTLMFMVLPNCRPGFRGSLPGALLASAGWLLFSGLYSVYAEHFASLRSIYGSVYAVALGMLWLYFGLCIVFYGGALNRWLGSSGGK